MTARLLAIATAAFVIAAPYSHRVHATAQSGFHPETIAMGTFGDINAFNHIVPPDFWTAWHRSDVWLSWQKTKGDSDLYIQKNGWDPGGTTGWHSHPGHSLIIVTSGTLTNYESDDPRCRPHVYTAPATFVGEGRSRAHGPQRDECTRDRLRGAGDSRRRNAAHRRRRACELPVLKHADADVRSATLLGSRPRGLKGPALRESETALENSTLNRRVADSIRVTA